MLSHGQMDKASIVSDAIEYVRELQKQVSEIQADIADLESQKEGQPKKDIEHLNEEKTREHKDIKHVNAKTIQKYQITAVCMPFLVECIHLQILVASHLSMPMIQERTPFLLIQHLILLHGM